MVFILVKGKIILHNFTNEVDLVFAVNCPVVFQGVSAHLCERVICSYCHITHRSQKHLFVMIKKCEACPLDIPRGLGIWYQSYYIFYDPVVRHPWDCFLAM